MDKIVTFMESDSLAIKQDFEDFKKDFNWLIE